jgi:hypothetical protein
MKLVEDLQMIAQNGNIPVFVKILCFYFLYATLVLRGALDEVFAAFNL